VANFFGRDACAAVDALERKNSLPPLPGSSPQAQLHDLSLIAAVFLLAGFVKGVIGLGLPTIAMGLLALIMPTSKAAALLIVPSLVTNAWQMFTGGNLAALLRRPWPMLLGAWLATWRGRG
jgi:hypothetical protein